MKAVIRKREVEAIQYNGSNMAECEVFGGYWIIEVGDWVVKFGDDDVRAYGSKAFDLMFEVVNG